MYPLVDMTANSERLLLKHMARTLSAVLHGFFIKGFEYTNDGTSDEVTCKYRTCNEKQTPLECSSPNQFFHP